MDGVALEERAVGREVAELLHEADRLETSDGDDEAVGRDQLLHVQEATQLLQDQFRVLRQGVRARPASPEKRKHSQ